MRRLMWIIGVALVGFVVGVVVCFLATPLLWKLEGPTGLELAGHSGPSDWLLVLAGFIGASAAIAIERLAARKRPGARP